MTIFVDPYKMAKRHETLQDRVAVSELARVKKLLASEAGVVNYQLQFGVDSENTAYIDGSLVAEMTFCCQRCLQPFVREVKCGFVVSPVLNDKEAKLLPSTYEPVIIQDDKLDPLELVEDELILALPIVAMHDVDALECKKSIDVSIEQVEDNVQELNQPFSILRTLKLSKNSQSAEDI